MAYIVRCFSSKIANVSFNTQILFVEYYLITSAKIICIIRLITDSADAWTAKRLLQLDDDTPKKIALSTISDAKAYEVVISRFNFRIV